MLYLDPAGMHWSLIVRTWIRKFPKFVPEAVREMLMDLFRRFCNPLLKLVTNHSSFKVSEHHLISSLIKVNLRQ